MELDESFRKMTVKELEHQYSPSRWSHRMSPDMVIKEHIQVLGIGSEKAKQDVDCQLDIPYGDSVKEKLDIFGAKSLPSDAPVLIYIHGGYWQDLGREISSYMSPAFTKGGVVVVAIGYTLAPNGNNIYGANHCASEKSFNLCVEVGKCSRIKDRDVYVCGHSAGGHLAAMMLAVDWTAECDCDIIKGVIPVSGVYDLRPLVETYVNDPIKMTIASALENSPVNHIQNICIHGRQKQVLIVVAEHDSSEFRRQSRQFYQELNKREMKVEFLDVKNKDHFDVIEHLRLGDYSLVKTIIAMMGLTDDKEIEFQTH